MRRFPSMFPIVLVAAMLFAAGVAIPGQPARAETPVPATPLPQPTELCDAAAYEGWLDDSDVRPFGQTDAVVTPAFEFATGEPTPARSLYLAVITLPPGKCMPYQATGNQKDGAIVLMVQAGIIDFTAQVYAEGSVPEIAWGDVHGPQGEVNLDETKRFYPGDWITIDQQVWVTYESVGGESAVIFKAVYAVMPPGSGCSGGCR